MLRSVGKQSGESVELVSPGVHVYQPLFGLTRSSAIAERPRDASCQWKSCNSAETTYATSPDQIDSMKLEI